MAPFITNARQMDNFIAADGVSEYSLGRGDRRER